MKKVVIILLFILVFAACGILGYQLANQTNPAQPQTRSAAAGRVGQGEQHNLVIIQVDQLDSFQPHLISIWYTSLYFLEDKPPALTFGQLYPMRTNQTVNQSIKNSFGLDGNGEPSAGFWRNLDTFKIKWEGYLLVDNVTIQRVLQWINGPGDYASILASGPEASDQRNQLVEQSCQKIAGIDQRQGPALEWSDLVPAHFHSNLSMEAALSYWNRVKTAKDVRCEILPAR